MYQSYELSDSKTFFSAEIESRESNLATGYDARTGKPEQASELTIEDVEEISGQLSSSEEAARAWQNLLPLVDLTMPEETVFKGSLAKMLYGEWYGFDEPQIPRDMYGEASPEGGFEAIITRTTLHKAITWGVKLARDQLLSTQQNMVRLGGVQACFRSEAAGDIKEGWKTIGFNQADIEVFARTDESLRPVDVDAETIGSGIDYFANSGIPNAVLQVRLNNPNRILYSILAQTGISLGEGANSFGWGLLDEMAAARVKGQPYESLREEALSEVAQWKQEDRLPVEAERFLTTLIIEGRYDMELLEQSFPDAYRAVLELAELKQRLSEKYPDATIQIDPLSTRMSYSETAWQYDVVSGQDTFAELGGGGVYTRVAALSWEKQFGQPAPKNLRCAGFAVGVMRADTVKQILAAKERNDG